MGQRINIKSFDDVLHNMMDGAAKADVSEDDWFKEPTYYIPSNNTVLDAALSDGKGWPAGCVIELFGDEHTGKTTEWIQLAIQVQQRGGIVYLFNAEGGFRPELAKLLGLDLSKKAFRSFRTATMEVAYGMLERGAKAAAKLAVPVLYVIDTLTGLCPAELSRKKGQIDKIKKKVGAKSQVTSWFFERGIVHDIAQSKVFLVFVNQVRARIATNRFDTGPNILTPGGRSLRFYSVLRLQFFEEDVKMNRHKRITGAVKKIEIVKNKITGKGKFLEVPVFYDSAWDDSRAIIYYLRQAKQFTHHHQGAYTLPDVKGDEKKGDKVNKKGLLTLPLVKGEPSWLSRMNSEPKFLAGMRKKVVKHYLGQYEGDDEWLDV